MDIQGTLERLDGAVSLTSDDAAIRIRAEYEPQAGPSTKVFPPTYMLSGDTRYHFEERWADGGERVSVAVLDSYQSQANRAEAALREVVEELGLPHLVMEYQVQTNEHQSLKGSISSLQAPHRSRDAYFLDSLLDDTAFDKTEIGIALNTASVENATAFLQYAPCDLVYGVWDSHRGKRIALKFPRSYTSEMLCWHALRGNKGATKGDPLNLPGKTAVPLKDWRPDMATAQKKKADSKLSEIGHGMIPGEVDGEAGGVSAKSITRDAIISLTGLARFRFPTTDGADADVIGRTALAALALLGDRLAFGRAGLHLRSGSDLVLKTEVIEWIRRGAATEPMELTPSVARELFEAARDRVVKAGIPWSGTPVRLVPGPKLQEVIDQTFSVPELEPEE